MISDLRPIPPRPTPLELEFAPSDPSSDIHRPLPDHPRHRCLRSRLPNRRSPTLSLIISTVSQAYRCLQDTNIDGKDFLYPRLRWGK